MVIYVYIEKNHPYYMNGDWYDEDKLHATKSELIKTL